jgi:hypothetical protein
VSCQTLAAILSEMMEHAFNARVLTNFSKEDVSNTPLESSLRPTVGSAVLLAIPSKTAPASERLRS